MALTFDCGSASGPTATILNILQQHGLKVTFFVTGQYADRYPELVQSIVAQGHELANHTYSHTSLTQLPDPAIREELRQAEASFQRIAGRSGRPWMRMPFGARDGRVLGVVTEEGYTSIFWTVDSGDWLEGATRQRVEQKVLGSVGNGGIVVHHCNGYASAEAMPAILNGLQAKGLRVVTVSALLGVTPPVGADPLLAPVSKSYALASGYAPSDLVELKDVPTARTGLTLRSAAYQALKAMLDEAERQGVRLYVLSAYRSHQEQAQIYQQMVQQLGEEQANRFSARPGHSEHQLGATIDFTTPRVNYDLVEAFAQTPEGRWLKENAHRFGFVLSYPEGKESVTGYAYEPWHYRYVGVDVAAAVKQSGHTLLEYLASRNQ